MENGNGTPFISRDTVRDALDNLIRVVPQHSANSLHFLLLVDLYLTVNPHLPSISNRRQFVLNNIIVSLINEQYSHQRIMLNLPPQNPVVKLQDTLEIIELEGQSGATELLSWSWLYHYYIRVDLNISHQLFCDAAHIDQRTLRRYQQHGMQRLTEQLIEAESKVRKEQHQRWLYSQLPGSAFASLIGRDKQIQQAGELLKDNKPSRLLITGSNGVGKSAFLGAIVKRQIDMGIVDRLIWIERPLSVEFINQHIRERIIPDDSTLSLREYGLLQRVIIVLDGIETLQNNRDSLDILFSELRTFCVLMTSSIYDAFLHCSHMVLKELLKEDIYALLDKVADGETGSSHEKHLAEIWENVGGNPMAAILTFRHWPFYQLQTLSLDNLFAQAYANLEPDTKRTWLFFSLLPPTLITTEQALEILPNQINEAALEYLITHHLLEVTTEETQLRCMLTSAGRRFIETRYHSDIEVQYLLQGLSDDFRLRAMHNLNPSDIEIIEFILLSNWLYLENREDWLAAFWRVGLQHGHYAEWRVFLEPYAQSNETKHLEFQIGYGVCLRHLSQWDKAQSIFEKVMRDAGIVGSFLSQAYAALECAALRREQGQYNKALELLSHVELTATRQQNKELLNALYFEQAQIALDMHNFDMLADRLGKLPETPRTFLIQCETCFLKGDYRELHTLSKQLEDVVHDDPYYLARLHALLGQSRERQNDLHSAYSHLCLALTMLERQNDLYALARVQSNLGAVMIQQGKYHDAKILLEYAERIQMDLHDQVGLSVTRHNTRLLTRKVVR